MKKKDHSQTEIAGVVGVHRSTISRELKRNQGQRGYQPKQANQFAMARHLKAKPKISQETWQFVEEKLREEWSPELISGWLKLQAKPTVIHERIYQYILLDKNLGGDLCKSLRCQKKRRKRYGNYDRRGQLPNRTSIDERPAIAEELIEIVCLSM